MSNNLQLLKRYIIKEHGEFSKDHIKYIANVSLSFVKDYWDLGAAVASGAVFAGLANENIPTIFGEYGLHAGIGLALTSLIGAGTNTPRPERNIHAGLGSLLFFSGCGDATRDATGFKIAGIFMGGLSIFYELGRRKETLTKLQQRGMIDSLKKIV